MLLLLLYLLINNNIDYTSDIIFHKLDACGGVINESNGTIQTPLFPDLYPPKKNCIWKILAPPKTTIFLNFTHFNLEGHNVS